ncbi:MAG: acyl-CoA thioesterase [Novosphingobium sp.]
MPRPDPALLKPERYPYSHMVTTRFADVDPNQHLNNVALAALMEDARVRFNQAIGLNVKIGERRAMVASVGMEYLAQGHFPDPVEARCAIEQVGRSSWSIAQLLVQNGRVIAFARSVIVAITEDRPAPVPDDTRLALEKWGLTP